MNMIGIVAAVAGVAAGFAVAWAWANAANGIMMARAARVSDFEVMLVSPVGLPCPMGRWAVRVGE